MQKILVPVDPSSSSQSAARHAAALARLIPEMQLCLLNVQEPVETHMHAFMSQQEILSSQGAESQRALRPVMEILDASDVRYRADWRTGDVAPTIAEYAKEMGCDAIVMGTRGLGAVGNLVMGSVATKVVHLVTVPVTLVK